MFLGSLPPKLLSIVQEHVRAWPGDAVYVGCSGNFTIERTIAGAGLERQMHSCDVTLYSCAIGSFLAGTPMRLEWTEPALAQFPWLENALGSSPEQDVATLMLCTRIADAFGRPDHPYYSRIVEGFRVQWEDLLDKTTKKLRDAAVGARLASFTAGDVFDWIDTVPRDAPVVSYPPFWEGGYTKMWANLGEMFDWDPPTFAELDDDRLAILIDKITDRPHWMLGTPEMHPRLSGEGMLRGRTRMSASGKEIWVYGSGGNPRLTMPSQRTSPLLVPKIGEDTILREGAEVDFVEITPEQLNTLRSLYPNRGIATAALTTGVGLGLLVDGVLVGAFALSAAPTFANFTGRVAQPHVYMLSDFPVAPSRHTRLSKLVVAAALSTEAAFLLERATNRRYASVVTTAFTMNAVSMKYRGLLDLISRAERTDGKPGYALNYGAPLKRWTLREGYDDWYSKHAQHLTPDREAPAP